jgi:hypothetical protein
MTLPFSLPDWVPWWLPFLVLVPGLLYALAFLLMPFSVFGVKGRLEAVEARLDEIQAEIRHLALRLPEPLEVGGYEEDLPSLHPLRDRAANAGGRPPIPPAPQVSADEPAPRSASAAGRRREPDSPARPPRAEPRLDWPR